MPKKKYSTDLKWCIKVKRLIKTSIAALRLPDVINEAKLKIPHCRNVLKIT